MPMACRRLTGNSCPILDYLLNNRGFCCGSPEWAFYPIAGANSMFGFFLKKKQEEVRQFLAGRMNRHYFRQFRYGDRLSPRGSFCEVVWVLPCDEHDSEPNVDVAFPVVTKDISNDGFSVTHNEPFLTLRMLVGFRGANDTADTKFVLCELEHSTSLGCGFFQIGLHPQEIVVLNHSALQQFRQRVREFEEEPEMAC